jgi:tetratricopeptide (TPR) repeat protein
MRLIIASLLLSFLIGGCGLFDPLNYESNQGAPEGTIEERNAWGKKHLGITYQHLVDWVKQAKVVKETVGNVIAVAPLGKPNYIESYFTDGLQGNFTMEIIGDKDKALFYANGISPCSTGSTCFQTGSLTVKDRKIAIHDSGISMEEFNQPINKITYLSNQIKFYNRQYPQNTPPHQSNSRIYKLWAERADVYAANKEFVNAISDIETAIALLSTGSDYSKISDEELNQYFVKLALYHYYLGQFNKSAEAIKTVIKQNKFENNKVYLNQNVLWLWLVRMREGKKDLAEQELRQSLQLAIKNKDLCDLSIAVARFFLGEIKEQEFLKEIQDNSNMYNRSCEFSGLLGVSDAYYYAGQKQIISGNIEKGKKMLQQSLERQGGPRLEDDIAIFELNKIDQTIPN